jgi:hypothetical protein
MDMTRNGKVHHESKGHGIALAGVLLIAGLSFWLGVLVAWLFMLAV